MTVYAAWGFDFAHGSGITVAQLHAQGCNFACRYLSAHPGTGKDLSAAEIAGYKAGGIALVLNWETSGQELSEAQGAADAAAAQAEAAALAAQSRIPAVATAPIIFSCDVSPSAVVEADAVAYMRGVNKVIGLARSGGYGGYAVIRALFDARVITYGWQTYAWSVINGKLTWDPRAQLQQYQNNVTIGPAQMDRDRATAADYGQVRWNAVEAVPGPGNDSGTEPFRLNQAQANWLAHLTPAERELIATAPSSQWTSIPQIASYVNWLAHLTPAEREYLCTQPSRFWPLVS